MKRYIFIIDLDSTLIGNCTYQLQLFNKVELMKSYNGPKINVKKILSPHYNEKVKLVRPNFTNFINKMREIYNNNVSFYIYTASSYNWANFQIKLIEKENNIKFNRPIFARNYCIMNNKYTKDKTDILFKKSITKILPKIKNAKDSDIIIIDDSDVYINYKDYHIQCKEYNYTLFNDTKAFLPDYMNNDLINGMHCPYNHSDCSIKNKLRLYKWLYKTLSKINKQNEKYKNDNFWINLTNAIEANKITEYTPDIIQQLIKIANKF